MNITDLVKKFDATLLAINATDIDRLKFLDRAKIVKPRSVVFNGEFLDRSRSNGCIRAAINDVSESGILISPVVDFPLGAGGKNVKYYQWANYLSLGAKEFDFCLNLGAFLSGQFRDCRDELEAAARVSRIKVIIHNYYLIERPHLVEDAAKLVRDSGAFCIKDATGFEPAVDKQKWLDNKRRFLEIAKATAPELQVKLAGGFKTLADIETFENIGGVDIYGISAFLDVYQAIKAKAEKE